MPISFHMANKCLYVDFTLGTLNSNSLALQSPEQVVPHSSRTTRVFPGASAINSAIKSFDFTFPGS